MVTENCTGAWVQNKLTLTVTWGVISWPNMIFHLYWLWKESICIHSSGEANKEIKETTTFTTMPTYRQNELGWVWKLPVLVVATVFTYGQLTICIIATPAKRIGSMLESCHGMSATTGCYGLPATIWNAICSWQRRSLPARKCELLLLNILGQIEYKTNFKLQQQSLPMLNQLLSKLLGCH